MQSVKYKLDDNKALSILIKIKYMYRNNLKE